MSVRVVLLGSGAVRPVPGRDGPAQVVVVDGDPLLFDCGRSAVTNLRRAGIPPESVDHVFLTHLHFDHVSDLPYFILVTWVIGRKQEVEVYGPVGTKEFVQRSVRGAYGEDLRSRFGHGRSPLGLDAHVTEVEGEGLVLANGKYGVRAMLVQHADMANLGYRVETSDRVVVVLGDVDRRQDLTEFVGGADLLLCECSGTKEFLEHPSRPWGAWHMTPEALADLATRGGVKEVVLKHFVMEDESAIAQMAEKVRRRFAGRVHTGSDGLEIVLDRTA